MTALFALTRREFATVEEAREAILAAGFITPPQAWGPAWEDSYWSADGTALRVVTLRCALGAHGQRLHGVLFGVRDVTAHRAENVAFHARLVAAVGGHA